MPLPVTCPLCGAGSESLFVVTPHVYGDTERVRAFFRCGACDVRFQFPRLTPDDEARFYTAEFEGFMAGRAGSAGGWQGAESHIQANEETRIRRMRYLERHLPPGGSVLEVGCSSGFMLFPLVERGHPCVGIEPSGVFGEYVRGRGLPVFPSVEAMAASEPTLRFDLIQHFFVLEHIAEPGAFLRQQVELLNPGGKIVIEIPNVADALHSVFDIPAFERFYWSIAHPWYFSEESLAFLLRQLSLPFEIQLDQRYDLSNHMTWARDGRPGGMRRYTGGLGRELEEAYKQALVSVGRADTLVAILGPKGE